MENFLKELNLQREATKRNIEKAFGNDIEKARSGVYADTAENRKLQRVGQHYGGRKQEQPTDSQPRAKKQEEQPKSGSKQKPDAGSKADIYSKMSQDEKIQVGSVLGKLMNVLGADKYKKEIDANKIKLTKTDDGNWKIEHNGNSISTISTSSISEETAKKIGWLEDEGDKGNGYNKEALEKFKKNKVREYYNNWNKDTDMFVSKNKKYWEKTLKKEMGVDSYDDFEDADDWKKYNDAIKIALNAIPAEKWAELADDDEKEMLKKEPKQRTASSLSQEEKAKKKSIRNKRNVIRALKTEVSGGKHLDSFLNENTEYFKDVLKKYSDDNVEDIYDLQEWLENRYENDENDPYGYGKYDEIIYECLEKIPAEKFDNFSL